MVSDNCQFVLSENIFGVCETKKVVSFIKTLYFFSRPNANPETSFLYVEPDPNHEVVIEDKSPLERL